MATIDENVEVGVELGVSSVRLTAKAIIAVINWFLGRENKKDYYQNVNDTKDKDKQGRQSVKDLFAKYQNKEVIPLKDNLEKEQMNFLSSELQKMGVDFSVHKVDNDNFSIFFAGKDVETIEKAMKNSVEKFTKREARREKAKDFFNSFRKQAEEEVEYETVDDDLTEEQKEEKVNEKMEEEFVKEATQAQKDLAEELGVVDYENMNRVEISLALEEAGADRSYFRDQQSQKEKENPEVSYDKEKVDVLYEEARDISIKIGEIENYEKHIKPNYDSIISDEARVHVDELRRDLSHDSTYPTQDDVEQEINSRRDEITESIKNNLDMNKGRTDELPELKKEYSEVINKAKKELSLPNDTKDDVVFTKMTDVFIEDNRTISNVSTKNQKQDKTKNKNKEQTKVQKQQKKPMFKMNEVNKRATEIKEENREKTKVKTKSQNRSL